MGVGDYTEEDNVENYQNNFNWLFFEQMMLSLLHSSHTIFCEHKEWYLVCPIITIALFCDGMVCVFCNTFSESTIEIRTNFLQKKT